jgi:hypothetical protein
MKAHEITLGGIYLAKVSSKLVKVRVDHIRTTHTGRTVYDVTNLTTGRRITFRSPQRFRGEYVNGERVVHRGRLHVVTLNSSRTGYHVYSRFETSTPVHVSSDLNEVKTWCEKNS